MMSVPHLLLPVALDYLLIAKKRKVMNNLGDQETTFLSFELTSRSLLREWPSSSCLRIDEVFNLSFLWGPFASCGLLALSLSSELVCSETEQLIPAAGNPDPEYGLYVEGMCMQVISCSVWKSKVDDWSLNNTWSCHKWLQNWALDSCLLLFQHSGCEENLVNMMEVVFYICSQPETTGFSQEEVQYISVCCPLRSLMVLLAVGSFIIIGLLGLIHNLNSLLDFSSCLKSQLSPASHQIFRCLSDDSPKAEFEVYWKISDKGSPLM